MQKNKFKELIENSQKIYIASHINPDGDNVGSLLALFKLLLNLKKNVTLIEDDYIPDFLKFLPNWEIAKKSVELDEKSDLFISLDCADIDRLGEGAKNLFLKSKNSINIDHHSTNTNYGSVNLIDIHAPATGEILYELIKDADYNIDSDIAKCIYTAISSDTGSFKYDSTRSRTFIIASELLTIGIDINEIAVNLYQNNSLEKTKLLSKSLNTLELFGNGKVATVFVDDNMIKECSAKKSDTEGIVESVRDISGVEVALFFKIKKDSIKLSIRTKSCINASKIALKYGGGGHIRAAGASLNLPFEERKKEIVKIALDEINEWNSNI
ncbi:MAG: DHH family phosphoesterase [Peptoniphilaceae bacterium]